MKLSLTPVHKQNYSIYHLVDDSPENGVWTCDCYIVKTKNSAIIIDPGYTRFEEARNLLDGIGATKGGILPTHGHWDHWYAAFDLLGNGFSEMYVHKKDDRYIDDLIDIIKKGESNPETVKNLSENLSALHGNKLNLKLDFLPANPDELEGFEKKINYFDKNIFTSEYNGIIFTSFTSEYNGITCTCRHDGSHTKGHVTYQIDRVLFAGDLVSMKDGKLQIESRTDHEKPGAARKKKEMRDAAKISIRKILNNRSNIDYIALGHGGFITVGEFVEKTRRFIK